MCTKSPATVRNHLEKVKKTMIFAQFSTKNGKRFGVPPGSIKLHCYDSDVKFKNLD